MSYRFNSTIRIKSKPCSRCGRVGPIFSKGRCKQCSTIETTMARMEQDTEDIIKEQNLQELIKDADDVYSKWLRLSGADKDGMVECYTCGARLRHQDAHCGHYLSRGSIFLRWDTRNTRIQDEACNIYKDGNIPEFTRRLELEKPGITEYLLEESRLVYHPTREEIKNIIKEYTLKLKQLKR